ncbi:uncharacterized protein LOC126379878 [Pectinophora gossypiella]|uniref:uncharacterized protein LOC126379878 n=1 Tax=Pectinophora gossypiella TaxID=13191 RepID=UPI00214F261D|nr:uncharacterized protein LOC126379878 [Pectinophora gossypiella]
MGGMRKPGMVQSNESPKNAKYNKQNMDARQKTGSPRFMNPSAYSRRLTYPRVMSFPYPPPPRPVGKPMTPPYPVNSMGYAYPAYPGTNWNSMVPMQTAPIYSSMPVRPVWPMQPVMPLPATMMRSPRLTAPAGPYGPIRPSPMIANPMMPVMPYTSPPRMPQYNQNYGVFTNYDQSFPREATDSHNTSFMSDRSNASAETVVVPSQRKPLDLEGYLRLPTELFPPARAFKVDPNPLIDLLCREPNIDLQAQWMLDLEFGMLKSPDRYSAHDRTKAMYDAQFNSVNCMNNPGTIHPLFETCSQDLKNAFLFYYDGIVSTWYKGYMIMNLDTSVANFQSWLQVPMPVFGMCWR